MNKIESQNEKINVNKELMKDFIKESQIMLVKSLKQEYERNQIILIPTSMYESVALLKISSLLKRNFNLLDSELEPQKKPKIF